MSFFPAVVSWPWWVLPRSSGLCSARLHPWVPLILQYVYGFFSFPALTGLKADVFTATLVLSMSISRFICFSYRFVMTYWVSSGALRHSVPLAIFIGCLPTGASPCRSLSFPPLFFEGRSFPSLGIRYTPYDAIKTLAPVGINLLLHWDSSMFSPRRHLFSLHGAAHRQLPFFVHLLHQTWGTLCARRFLFYRCVRPLLSLASTLLSLECMFAFINVLSTHKTMPVFSLSGLTVLGLVVPTLGDCSGVSHGLLCPPMTPLRK